MHNRHQLARPDYGHLIGGAILLGALSYWGRYIVQLNKRRIEDQPSHLPIRMPELSSSRLRA
jgi:hypothetical protein